jgi:hypothetical protein
MVGAGSETQSVAVTWISDLDKGAVTSDIVQMPMVWNERLPVIVDRRPVSTLVLVPSHDPPLME